MEHCDRVSTPCVADLGCGPKKRPGCLGIDHHPYPGVDVVCDLDETPWPVADDSFDRVFASHVIEHLASIPSFMSEVHRVSRPGCTVELVTPHFSSLDSWKDPTHRWHLACDWHETFCRADVYLARQVPRFEPLSTEVTFTSSLRNIPARALVRLLGRRVWEKHYAFRYPARNIRTVLRVEK